MPPCRPGQLQQPLPLHAKACFPTAAPRHQGDCNDWPESHTDFSTPALPQAAAICDQQPRSIESSHMQEHRCKHKTAANVVPTRSRPSDRQWHALTEKNEAPTRSRPSDRQWHALPEKPEAEHSLQLCIGTPAANVNSSQQADFVDMLGHPPRGTSRQAQAAAMESEQIERLCWRALSDESSGDEDACAICCESLAPGDTAWKLPCGHCEWHEACIHKWLRKHSTCPMCREPIDVPWRAASSHSRIGDAKKLEDFGKPAGLH